MIKQQKILFAVLINTILAFLIDLIVGYKENWLLIILIEVPIIAIIFLALKGQKWAYIVTIVYYLIRSFNVYFEDFYLITKNGLNFEVTINSIAINIVSFIFFMLLFYDLQRTFNSRITRIIRITTTILIIMVCTYGAFTVKPEKYDKAKYNTPMVIEIDTVAKFQKDFTIQTPDKWQVKSNYRGFAFVAVGPQEDTADTFKENFNIRVYNVNLDIFDANQVGNWIYAQGSKGTAYNIEAISKGISNDFPDFYMIELLISDSTKSVRSRLFCKVENRKAYTINYTDADETFFQSYEQKFKPILSTFKIIE